MLQKDRLLWHMDFLSYQLLSAYLHVKNFFQGASEIPQLVKYLLHMHKDAQSPARTYKVRCGGADLKAQCWEVGN